MTNSEIRYEALGSFAELLAGDRMNYEEGLDYYEVRFKESVANLRKNAARKPTRLKKRSSPLDPNPDNTESGEFSPHIEKAAGAFDSENFDKYFGSHDRARLAEAINTLSELQIAILEMWKNEIPIDSQDPEVFTISKALDKAEKTIRLQRDQALKTLAKILGKGEV